MMPSRISTRRCIQSATFGSCVTMTRLAPDWRTITWTEAERAKGQAWGLKTIESFHTHGTPPVEAPHA